MGGVFRSPQLHGGGAGKPAADARDVPNAKQNGRRVALRAQALGTIHNIAERRNRRSSAPGMDMGGVGARRRHKATRLGGPLQKLRSRYGCEIVAAVGKYGFGAANAVAPNPLT